MKSLKELTKSVLGSRALEKESNEIVDLSRKSWVILQGEILNMILSSVNPPMSVFKRLTKS